MAQPDNIVDKEYNEAVKRLNELQLNCTDLQKRLEYKCTYIKQLEIEIDELKIRDAEATQRERDISTSLVHATSEKDSLSDDLEKCQNEMQMEKEKEAVIIAQCHTQQEILNQRFMAQVERVAIEQERHELTKEKLEKELLMKQKIFNDNIDLQNKIEKLRREMEENQKNQELELNRKQEQALLVADHWQRSFEKVDKERQQLQSKLTILFTQANEEMSYSKEQLPPPSSHDTSPTKRGRFSVFTDQLECRRCKMKYDASDNQRMSCRYHPVPEAQHVMWKRFMPIEKASDPVYSHYKYWLCCGEFKPVRPPGCCHGYHVS